MISSSTILKRCLTLLLLGVLLTACFKAETYPNEPIISNAQVSISGSTAILKFDFTDGDGDIGLSDSQQSAPYDSSSYYHFNLYIEYFESDDVLGWVPGQAINGDTIVFTNRLEPISFNGKAKGIKGVMEVEMDPFRNPSSSESDTIKYKVTLIDRALNISNELETGAIVVP
ncbi:MAG: hypothetical protein MK078_00485 [Crocinitomicaceae bacterium]|nr:hypothetical protein [Crocinitomicaceae bacterium]